MVHRRRISVDLRRETGNVLGLREGVRCLHLFQIYLPSLQGEDPSLRPTIWLGRVGRIRRRFRRALAVPQ